MWRRFGQRLALVLLPTVLLIGTAEVLIRLTGAEHVVARRVTKTIYPVAPGNEDGLFATRLYDPVLSWRLRPHGRLPWNAGTINSLGFVGEEFEWQKAPGTTRIVTMGDSVTYGVWQCDRIRLCRQNPYPEALAALLRAQDGPDRFQVVNAGVYGYSSLQGLRYYRTYLTGLDADIVTVMFGWNDHGRLAGWEGREPRHAAFAWLVDEVPHLATYRLLVGVTALLLTRDQAKATPYIPAYQPRVALDDFAYNLEQFARAVQRHGAHVLFITEPCGPLSEPYRKAEVPPTWVFSGATSYEAMVTLHEQYNERTRAVSAQLGVPLVDVAREFDRRDKARLFSPYDLVHPNEAGYALIAELVYRRLAAEDWIPQPAPARLAVPLP